MHLTGDYDTKDTLKLFIQSLIHTSIIQYDENDQIRISTHTVSEEKHKCLSSYLDNVSRIRITGEKKRSFLIEGHFAYTLLLIMMEYFEFSSNEDFKVV